MRALSTLKVPCGTLGLCLLLIASSAVDARATHFQLYARPETHSPRSHSEMYHNDAAVDVTMQAASAEGPCLEPIEMVARGSVASLPKEVLAILGPISTPPQSTSGGALPESPAIPTPLLHLPLGDPKRLDSLLMPALFASLVAAFISIVAAVSVSRRSQRLTRSSSRAAAMHARKSSSPPIVHLVQPPPLKTRHGILYQIVSPFILMFCLTISAVRHLPVIMRKLRQRRRPEEVALVEPRNDPAESKEPSPPSMEPKALQSRRSNSLRHRRSKTLVAQVSADADVADPGTTAQNTAASSPRKKGDASTQVSVRSSFVTTASEGPAVDKQQQPPTLTICRNLEFSNAAAMDNLPPRATNTKPRSRHRKAFSTTSTPALLGKLPDFLELKLAPATAAVLAPNKSDVERSVQSLDSMTLNTIVRAPAKSDSEPPVQVIQSLDPIPPTVSRSEDSGLASVSEDAIARAEGTTSSCTSDVGLAVEDPQIDAQPLNIPLEVAPGLSASPLIPAPEDHYERTSDVWDRVTPIASPDNKPKPSESTPRSMSVWSSPSEHHTPLGPLRSVSSPFSLPRLTILPDVAPVTLESKLTHPTPPPSPGSEMQAASPSMFAIPELFDTIPSRSLHVTPPAEEGYPMDVHDWTAPGPWARDPDVERWDHPSRGFINSAWHFPSSTTIWSTAGLDSRSQGAQIAALPGNGINSTFEHTPPSWLVSPDDDEPHSHLWVRTADYEGGAVRIVGRPSSRW
ncbi:hypothetical protein M427DRAFT_75492 [Gonapodya prolifera JEL478]|uniref:Transmembrane protein n=1 Tax=Gonapodya prolifera (strain JEL478) TaxID=1344416 RepID=A0A138ZY54_GONPJ|nr:hypothetical protein M427DRAFT_75492 [Gonapodya prolifera JEL478]|eukprot:KXS09427.1 hypothetical protein M427DRAFT_75492 [Gonapodya prolifera JEL478]